MGFASAYLHGRRRDDGFRSVNCQSEELYLGAAAQLVSTAPISRRSSGFNEKRQLLFPLLVVLIFYFHLLLYAGTDGFNGTDRRGGHLHGLPSFRLVIQPPVIKLLTTEKERKIKMEQLRPYPSLRESIPDHRNR